MVKRKRPGTGLIKRKKIKSQANYEEKHASSCSTGDNFQLRGEIPRILSPFYERDCKFSAQYAEKAVVLCSIQGLIDVACDLDATL